MHRRTTIVEAAVRTKLRRGLTPHRRAVIRRRRALIPRRLTRRLPVLTPVLPTPRLRVPIPLLAAVMEAVVAGVMAVEVAVALTAEAAVADREEVALTEAVHTDARISEKKARSKFGAGFFVLMTSVKRNPIRTTLRLDRCLV